MACTMTLSGIAYDCGVNLSGVKNIYLADWNDVTAVALDASGVEISEITMASSKKFKHYVFAKNTASLTKTLTKSENTGVKYYTNELVANFNKMDEEKRAELGQLDGGQIAALVEDQNGIFWYLGYDNYASASAVSGQTGAAADDGNFYSLTITDVSGKLPYSVDASAAAAVIE